MDLGARVRTQRERLGMSQSQLAAAAGMSQPSLSRLEAGRGGEPMAGTLLRLANALRVPTDWLLGRTDQVVPSDVLQFDPDAREMLRGYSRLNQSDRKHMAQWPTGRLAVLRLWSEAMMRRVETLLDEVKAMGPGQSREDVVEEIIRTLNEVRDRMGLDDSVMVRDEAEERTDRKEEDVDGTESGPEPAADDR